MDGVDDILAGILEPVLDRGPFECGTQCLQVGTIGEGEWTIERPLTTHGATSRCMLGSGCNQVNFFLIATTFLVTAYVSATVGGYPSVAAGVAFLGVWSSYVFYRIERRIRRLIHAAEAALRPIELELATKSSNPALRILDSVEYATPDEWTYATVFRRLYVAVGLAFAIAALFAIGVQFQRTPQTTTLFPVAIRLAAGVVLLVFASEVFAASSYLRRVPSSADRGHLYTLLVVGTAAALAGVTVLVWVGLGVVRP